MSNRIHVLATRVQNDEFFLASALADYARSEHLDDADLARVLGCAAETLAALRLCRRPRSEPVFFRQDIAQIVSRFQVNAIALAEVVRRSDSLTAMRRAAKSEHGLLMAARDRRDKSPGIDEMTTGEAKGEQL